MSSGTNLMSPHEKAQLLRLIEKLPTTTKCFDCQYWQNSACALAGAAPPPEVLETGCEQWVFNPQSPPF